MSPSLICCYMFLVSACAAFVGNKNWGADVSIISVLAIAFFLISICLGEGFSRRVNIFPDVLLPGIKRSETKEHVYIKVNTAALMVLIIVGAITFYKYFNMILAFSEAHGNPFGVSYMLKYYRIGMREGDSLNMGFLLTQSIQLCKFLSYLFVYILINNFLYFRKVNLLMIVYIAEAWGIYALSSSRGGYINFISAYLIIIFCSLMKKNKWKFKQVRKKFVLLSVFAIVVFFYLFSVLGSFTGKTAQADGPFNQIITYAGGSIISFDDFMRDYSLAQSNDAFESLSGIKEVLGYIGFEFDNKTVDLEFVNIGGLTTNIYTALRRYIHDFSYVGALILGLFIGIFYGEMYKKIKYRHSDYSFLVLLYAGLIYPLFYISSDEMFMRGVFSLGSIYMLVYFYVIWIWLGRKLARSTRRYIDESSIYSGKQ